MFNILSNLNDYLVRKLWGIDLKSIKRFKLFYIKGFRLIYVAVIGVTEEQLALRAMSLVYTTLLSLVPLLAISFSVLKAFGVHARFEVFLYNFLEPLGQKGIDLSNRIIGFVENVNASVLGSVGFIMLIYTVISQIQKIESALNYIWRVKGTRRFNQRFSNYLSVLLIGPVLIFSAIGITASFMSTTVILKLTEIEPFGTMIYFTGLIIPYVFVCSAFTFIYISLPNTRVRFLPALTGGIFAGVVWKATGMVFTSFILSSAQYSAVYAGFALVILFLIWLYWSFFILLVGARVAFYQQYPYLIASGHEPFSLGSRFKEKLAMMIMFLIGHNFYHGKEPWKMDSFLDKLGLPYEFIHDILARLEKNGLVTQSNNDHPAYLPARDIEGISLKDVIDSVRADKEGKGIEFHSIHEIDMTIKHMDNAIADSLGGETIKSLIISKKG